MPNPTMKLIASVTVGAGGAASIDFTSIPGTYTDLCLKYSLRGNGGATIRSVQARFNSNSSSVYSAKIIDGNGSTASSAGYANDVIFYWAGWANDTNSTANTFSNCEMYIPNYAGSANKSFSLDAVAENNATTANTRLEAGLWGSSTAITSINLIGETAFLQYSTAYLYGISNS